jgi:hypothetical protein
MVLLITSPGFAMQLKTENANNAEINNFLTMPRKMFSQDRGIACCHNQFSHNNNAMTATWVYYQNAFAAISFPLKKIAKGF